MKLLLLLLCLNLVNCQLELEEFDFVGGDDFDYPDYPCSSAYYEDPSSEECHKDKHPTKTLVEEFGENVKECCSNHGYVFVENCEDDPNENKPMCHDINGGTNVLKLNLTCPKHCTTKQLVSKLLSFSV